MSSDFIFIEICVLCDWGKCEVWQRTRLWSLCRRMLNSVWLSGFTVWSNLSFKDSAVFFIFFFSLLIQKIRNKLSLWPAERNQNLCSETTERTLHNDVHHAAAREGKQTLTKEQFMRLTSTPARLLNGFTAPRSGSAVTSKQRRCRRNKRIEKWNVALRETWIFKVGNGQLSSLQRFQVILALATWLLLAAWLHGPVPIRPSGSWW